MLTFTLKGGETVNFLTMNYHNVLIEMINHTDDKTYKEELFEDVLSIITVFSSRLYGSRSHKTKRVIDEIKNNDWIVLFEKWRKEEN